MKRSLSFYTLFFIFCMGIMRLSGLFSKMILARAITPYEYGIITLMVVSLPSMFQILTTLFFYDILSHSSKGRKYFGFSMLYSAVVSLLIGFLVFVFHNEIFGFLNIPPDGWEYLFVAFFIVLLPTALLVNIMGILRGYKKYSMTSLLSASPSVLRLFIIAAAVYILSVKDFNHILLLFAVPVLITTLFVFIKEWKRLAERLRETICPSKDILLFGFSIFVVSIFIGLTQSIAKIIVSHDLGVEWQGYFDVSFSIITILVFSFGAMQFISIPEATSNKNKKDLLFKKGELGDVARGLFAFLIFCVIILYFYSVPLVDILFSEDYIQSADYIFILAIGYISLFVQQFLAYLNISMSNNLKEYKNLFLVTLIMLISFPFVTHFMILSLGFMGAYISTTTFLILYSLATICYSKDRSPLRALMHKADRLIIASLITFLLIYYFNLSVFVGIVVSSVIYVFLLFSLGYLHKDLILNIFYVEKEHH